MFSRATKSVVRSLGQCRFSVDGNLKAIGAAGEVGSTLPPCLKNGLKFEPTAVKNLGPLEQMTTAEHNFGKENSEDLVDILKKLPIAEEAETANNLQMIPYSLQSEDGLANMFTPHQINIIGDKATTPIFKKCFLSVANHLTRKLRTMKISKELQRWIFERKMRVYRPPREAPPQPPLPQVFQFDTRANRLKSMMAMMTNFRNSSNSICLHVGNDKKCMKILFPMLTTNSLVWRRDSLTNRIFQSFSRPISTAVILQTSDSKCKTITELCTKKETCKTKKLCPKQKATCPEEEKKPENKCKSGCLPKLNNSGDKRKCETPEKQEYPPTKCNPKKIGGLSPCPCKFTPKEMCQEIPAKKICPPPPSLPKSPSKPIVLCPCPPPPKLPPTSCPCVPEVVNEICENEKPPKPCPPKPKKPCANQSYNCSERNEGKKRK
ncbi:uncharacterized protein LOC122503406 isoform X2 [Leptopilina heterotoma]|uniref:uncharacterized protein LOC122503406 isoform X2 n=1 Tax=Leptopilina heterotoma TaxID=63436 RepID=UPI001CA9FF22|nr:uncharacterized protein LOC122503406 isoform X2 [Leptopilina heterotoma]